jgi:cell division protein FtsB
MGWFALGFVLGFVVMWNRKGDNTPKDLEKAKAELGQQEQDIAYYKKLTNTLVEENKELRKQINAS